MRTFETANLAKLATSSFLTVLADRSSQFLLLSVVVMSGPGGEGTGSSSVALLLPVVLFGIICGVIVDRLGSRRTIILTSTAPALVLLACPAIMIMTMADRLSVSIVVSVICSFSVACSLGRFAWAPQLVQPTHLQKANSLLWSCTTTATLIAVLAVVFMPGDFLPGKVFKACSLIYFVGAVAAWSIKKAINPVVSASVLPEQPGSNILTYLKRHGKTQAVILMSIIFSVVFLLWNAILLYVVAAENYQPGGIDLHSLLEFALGGTILGTLLAPRAAAIAKPQGLFCGTICGVFLASLICALANNLMIVKYALALAGVNSGMALVAADTMLQRCTPSRMRGTVAGCRDTAVAALLLVAVLAVEQSFEKVALVNVFRGIAAGHLFLCAAVFLTWKHSRQFAIALLTGQLFANKTSGQNSNRRNQLEKANGGGAHVK
ncbi:MAG TPA: MFS transporter [Trichormus sp.]|jgi:MFS family permease